MSTAPTSLSGSTPNTPTHHRERPFYALFLRLLAVLGFSVMFTGGKLASEHGVNLVEIVFYRQLLAMPVVVASILLGPGLASIRTDNFRLHIGRATLGLIGIFLNFLAFVMLPLAEATTIGFSMPIFATILSAVLLREPTGIHRWAAVLLGFTGVLVIAQPGTHFDMPINGVGVAITAAILTAFVSILIRKMGKTETPTTIVFWFCALPIPPLLCLMPFFGQAHDGVTWAILVTIGISGGFSQLLMTLSLRWGPVALVLPMDYSNLIWATLFGWLFWNKWPAPTTWIGAALIVASGLYIALREHKRLREIRNAVPIVT
ncbi:MAG: DMT family transporter [Sphingobium sp.]